MKMKDIFEETFISFNANKSRTFLTMLGIVIGVGSVIAMMAIGTGSTQKITSSIESIGSNLIFITPGAARTFGAGPREASGGAKSLTIEDMEAISSKIAGIKNVTGSVSSRQQVVYKSNNDNLSINGVYPSYFSVRNITVSDGEAFDESAENSSQKVAVIGPTLVTTLYGEDATSSDVIGQTFKIGSYQFKIIGVTESKGGSITGSSDSNVYIPLSTAQKIFTGNKYLSNITVSAASSDSITNVTSDITSLLLERHNLSESDTADFSISTQSDMLSSMSSITTTLTYLLGAIASISLLVGGIGIMNMMLTSVTERTKEIGLRKAIGAKNKDISTQFLTESIILTVAGGIIGIILGFLISSIVNISGVTNSSVSISSIILATGVSIFIGVVFGYYPAKRAAKLNPIDALRYE